MFSPLPPFIVRPERGRHVVIDQLGRLLLVYRQQRIAQQRADAMNTRASEGIFCLHCRERITHKDDPIERDPGDHIYGIVCPQLFYAAMESHRWRQNPDACCELDYLPEWATRLLVIEHDEQCRGSAACHFCTRS